MFQLNVTIGLNEETLNLFRAILGNGGPVARQISADKPQGVKVSPPKPEKVNGHKPVQPVVEEEQEHEGDGETTTIAPTKTTTEKVTIEQVRAKSVAIQQADATKRPKVKDLVNEFGVKSISLIPEERLAEFLKKLEAL